jgi:hypothetical protein
MVHTNMIATKQETGLNIRKVSGFLITAGEKQTDVFNKAPPNVNVTAVLFVFGRQETTDGKTTAKKARQQTESKTTYRRQDNRRHPRQ